jgi:hypothetical protein
MRHMKDLHLLPDPRIGELWEDTQTNLVYIVVGYDMFEDLWEVVALTESDNHGWEIGEKVRLTKDAIVGDICYGIVTTHE